MAIVTQQYSINRNSNRGNYLATVLDQLSRFMENLPFERLKMIQAYTDPTAPGTPNWANVETLYGLPSGTGSLVFAQIDGACGATGDPNTNPGASTITKAGVWAALSQLLAQVG